MDGTILKIKNNKARIKQLNSEMKVLRAELKQSMDEAKKFLEQNNQKSIRMNGISVSLSTKERRKPLTKEEKKSNLLRILNKYSNSPDRLYEEVLLAQKGKIDNSPKLEVEVP